MNVDIGSTPKCNFSFRVIDLSALIKLIAMKEKYRFQLAIFLLFIGSSSTAQTSGVQMGKNLADHLLIKTSDKYLYRDEASKVEGTPFLDESFVDGNVQTNKAMFEGVPMRYDMFNDQIEFKQSNNVYILDPDPQIKKIEIGENVVMVVGLHDRLKGNRQFGFFTMLDSGKLTLMLRQVVVFQEEQLPKALESSSTPAKYLRSADVYFYKIGTGKITRIESVSRLIKSLPDHNDEVAKFAKKESISVRKAGEILTLVQYYNALNK